ncbi:auxin-induced protein IAA6-like isoform X2 [Amaranthus tricolor]|uniref:auxin-induced protein IAA6-like isoform X2 n=1 Tax=Amaranthus tricolor TaxID=29722 RepID=UPI0025910812|nr:auxin-induced protein IAA6-like isoform X2 [Amaranthus tricolor]
MMKPGFELEITELRLGLPGGRTTNPLRDDQGEVKNDKKRMFSEIGGGDDGGGGSATEKMSVGSNKTAAVGWPPVCSYRRKSIGSEKDCMEASKRLIKISMDGVPFLRKIEVSCYQQYSDFVVAVENLFGCPGIKALEDADNCEYVPIYEDKDGDWLLVGDVPWNMFVESCKRLRIMKRADAKGFGLQSKKQCHG